MKKDERKPLCIKCMCFIPNRMFKTNITNAQIDMVNKTVAPVKIIYACLNCMQEYFQLIENNNELTDNLEE